VRHPKPKAPERTAKILPWRRSKGARVHAAARDARTVAYERWNEMTSLPRTSVDERIAAARALDSALGAAWAETGAEIAYALYCLQDTAFPADCPDLLANNTRAFAYLFPYVELVKKIEVSCHEVLAELEPKGARTAEIVDLASFRRGMRRAARARPAGGVELIAQ
jgi:hypothetical protein